MLPHLSDPTFTVRVVPNVNTPMVGSLYILTCVVDGAGRLDHYNLGATVDYRWFKDGAVDPGQTVTTIAFNPLTFSDAGGYTCQATITSSLFSTASITTSMTDPVSIRLTCELYCHATCSLSNLTFFHNVI